MDKSNVQNTEGEQVVVNNESAEVEGGTVVDNASKTKVSNEQTVLPKEPSPQEVAYNNMVRSYCGKVVVGELKLDEIPEEAMRKDVQARIDSLRHPLDEKKVAERVSENMELKGIINAIDPGSREQAKSEYDLFRSKGVSHDDAMTKLVKLYDLESTEERREREVSFGQRTRRIGSAPAVNTKPTYTPEQAAMARACGNDPDVVYKN
jgi:hypothetical protein